MQIPLSSVLGSAESGLIDARAVKRRPSGHFARWVRRGSLAKAAIISSFLVVVGLVALVRIAAWLLPKQIHLSLPGAFLTFLILSVLALLFAFPVMWSVRVFYRDDIAELENRVAERTAQLRAANKELEAFSYSVSHDLRAPLRHIDGFARILSAHLGPDVQPDARQSLERIRDATTHMGHLIDDLLKMAQIGRQEVMRRTVDLRALTNSVIQDLRMEYDGRLITFKIADLPHVECDPGLMKVVFTNLLSNAIKYTSRVDHAVIEVGEMTQDGVRVIFVRDNGAGFNEKYAHKLFGVFQRLHRADEFEGTGVGLATVQRILEKHGGRIWAEGKVDLGATFYFSI